MARFLRSFLFPALLLLPLTAAGRGGWFVVTVHDWPDSLVPGEEVELAFTIRQHGMHPLEGRTAWLRMGEEAIPAAPILGTPGAYRARVTPRRPGPLTLVVDPDFYGLTKELPPLDVLPEGLTARTDLSPRERGRRLFMAKGCWDCHYHEDAPGPYGKGFAPELSNRSLNAGILRAVMEDPQGILEFSSVWEMPQLELTDAEMDAIIAFLNG